jgi:tetratricopeptide (TPR) repeat protein
MALFGAGLFAQTVDKMGSDPEACAKYQSLYQEFYKQGNFRDAMSWWLLAVETCPRYSKNLYIHGVKLFEVRIADETDQRKKSALVDSLLWVYDTRMTLFGEDARSPKGYILGLKGIAIQKYRREDYPKGYKILGESIRLMGLKSTAAVVLTYMQASQQLFRDGAIDAGRILSDYETAMDIIDANLKLNPGDEAFSLTKDQVEVYFTGSGAATCDALTKLYTAGFTDRKDDIGWLSKVIQQLSRTGCAGSGIFAQSADALFRLDPTSECARNLASVFQSSDENEKAALYLQKAIDLGHDSESLADMYYELGSLNFNKFRNYPKARELAAKASEARPNWGKPYLLIGEIFIAARSEVFSNSLDQATVYWLAVDKFIKAKTVDPEVADEANNLINANSGNFPSKEMVALHSLHEGDSYTIGSWMNETTRVRLKKN